MKRFAERLVSLFLAVLVLAALAVPALAAYSSADKVPYTDAQIRQLVSLLYRAPTAKEFLDEPFRGRIDNNGRAVYGYNAPTPGSAKSFTVSDEEEVTVVAYYKTNDRYCVIINSMGSACWVNAAFVSLVLD